MGGGNDHISLYTHTKFSNNTFFKIRRVTEKMAQRLRDLTFPVEDLGLVLITHVYWFTTTYHSKIRGSDVLFWPPREPACLWSM